MPHTFVDQEQLFTYLMAYGWIFPASIILTFLIIYRYALLRRIKQEIRKRKDLTDISHRSNGHHKPKEKQKML